MNCNTTHYRANSSSVPGDPTDVNYLDGDPAGIFGIRVRQVNPATLDLEPGAGGATAADVLANNNPLSTTQVLGTVTISADDNVVLPPSTPATPNLPTFLTADFDAGLLPAVAVTDSDTLSQADLARLVDAAIGLFADAGATGDQVAAMRAVEFSVADLFGRRVGSSDPGSIVLDSNGAGYGWFVDPMLGAFDGAGAAGRIDALSVILHELGHQIGFTDHVDGGLMSGFIDTGERRLPGGLFETEPALAPLLELAAFEMPLHYRDMVLHSPDLAV